MITMKINGMMCPHCQAAVKKALEAFQGVTADVNLEDKAAYITAEAEVDKEELKKIGATAVLDVKGGIQAIYGAKAVLYKNAINDIMGIDD